MNTMSNRGLEVPRTPQTGRMHPAWWSFVQFCGKLQHGEIERLRIQDGLPVLAEMTTKKIKFT
jgi:hypothetical protein